MYIINEFGLLVSSLTMAREQKPTSQPRAHETPQPSLPQDYVDIIKSNRVTCPIKAYRLIIRQPSSHYSGGQGR